MYNIKNDKSLLFSLVKILKGYADNNNRDFFTLFFIRKMLIPYENELGKAMQTDFYNAIGFNKEPTIDRVYVRLLNIKLID